MMRPMARGTASPPIPVDERLIAPDTRYEVIDGRVCYVSPADPPHASRHSKLSALLEAYVAPGYDAASDMLTRTSETGDMAPDGSVYPSDPDPHPGGRQLEEVAFEVVSTGRLPAAGDKAAALCGGGVRRVFAIDVAERRLLEWSRPAARWEALGAEAVIEDRVFVIPLPVAELMGAAKADDGVAKALLAKRNPVLMRTVAEGEERGRARGLAEGKAEALLALLRARGLAATEAEERRIRGAGEAEVDRWLERVVSCRSVAELLDR